ncbi:Bacteriophage P2-related tail formation protein [uncultured Flavonifractor sp.]|nr:Bacteriophage P2-related tail formation protein [uncultured Flavonifractor sp.]
MSEMKLNTLEFIRLLPQFMRDDGAVKGLAAAMDEIVPELAQSTAALSTWDHIDDLTEAELDALAWELNILWYDTGASMDTKRALVKDSDIVYQRLGTKWAVENVINSYFGEGYVEEWFEYQGQPGHFRVYSTNPSLNNERLTEFLNLLNKVKRASAKLDGIFITLTGKMPLYAGVTIKETSKEQYSIGAKL